MFEKLFSPITINKMQLRNRIVMPAMHVGYCDNGFVTEKFINFYRERAKGGAGLIIVGGCKVDKFAGGLPSFISVDDDKYIDGLKKLTDAIHSEGAKISCQLYHAGRYAHSMLIGGTPLSASAVRSKFTGEVPKEMTKEEIRETIENIAKAANRAKESGFDGVELLGSAGYLINQFLSPLTNKRTDEYGGSFENRLRFPLELIKRVRETVGHDFVVDMRMSGDDLMEGSNTLTENKIIAKEYEKAGIDFINVTGGWHETKVPQISMFVPRGAFVYFAESIKKEVHIPVTACNRINNPFLAEEILKRGKADLIGMGRGLIADPEFPKKAKEGRVDEIRKCVACNQGCFDSVFDVRPISCMVNPAAGREKECELIPADKPKNILIIGAGVAGLEAARVLKLRGHNVTIYEKESKIGGQLNLAAVPPYRDEFKNIIEYYNTQIKKLGIKLKLGEEINPEIIAKLSPDVVIVATGSTQIKPNIKGIDNKNVVYAYDVLDPSRSASQIPNTQHSNIPSFHHSNSQSEIYNLKSGVDKGGFSIGQKVVVIGGGGVGCETALYLAKKDSASPDAIVFLLKYKAIDAQTAIDLTNKGCDVTIIEMLDRVGKDIGRSTRWTVMSELRESNVKIITGAKVEEIKEDGVIIEVQSAKSKVQKAKGQMTNDKTEITNSKSQIPNLTNSINPKISINSINPINPNNQFIPADTVVIAVGTKPENKLAEEIKEKGIVKEVYVIGDAQKIGKAIDAIRDGFEIGRKI